MGVIVLCVYAVMVFKATSRTMRASGSPEAFFVNNRAAGVWSVAFSVFASCIGASTTLGVMGLAFVVGTPALWWVGSGAAGMLVLGLFLACKVRQSKAWTMPELVETFLGTPCRKAVSVIILLAWTAILAAQLRALSGLIGPMTGFGSATCLTLGLALVAGHTLGGQAAVIKVDRVQTAIIVAGLMAMLAFLSAQNPVWAERVPLEWANPDMGTDRILYLLCVIGGSYLVCPMLFGRFLSAKCERTARRGAFVAAGMIMLCALLIVSAGIACRGLVAPGTPPDEVFPSALAILPGWLGLILMASLVAAVVSSADSCLLTASTILCHDVLGRVDMTACRSSVIALGLCGAGVSLMERDILGFLLMANDVYVCGVVVPVGIGMVMHHKRRIAPGAALGAVCLGGFLGGVAALTEMPVFTWAGMATSAGLTVAGIGWKSETPGRIEPNWPRDLDGAA